MTTILINPLNLLEVQEAPLVLVAQEPGSQREIVSPPITLSVVLPFDMARSPAGDYKARGQNCPAQSPKRRLRTGQKCIATH